MQGIFGMPGAMRRRRSRADRPRGSLSSSIHPEATASGRGDVRIVVVV